MKPSIQNTMYLNQPIITNQKIKEYLLFILKHKRKIITHSSLYLIYTVFIYKRNADLAHCSVTYFGCFGATYVTSECDIL